MIHNSIERGIWWLLFTSIMWYFSPSKTKGSKIFRYNQFFSFMSQYVYVSNWPCPFIGMSVPFLSPSYCIPIWKNYRRIKGIIRWQIELGIPALWSGRRWKNNKIGNAGNCKRNELKQPISIRRVNSENFSFSTFSPFFVENLEFLLKLVIFM